MVKLDSPAFAIADLVVEFNTLDGPFRAVDGMSYSARSDETRATGGKIESGKTVTVLAARTAGHRRRTSRGRAVRGSQPIESAGTVAAETAGRVGVCGVSSIARPQCCDDSRAEGRRDPAGSPSRFHGYGMAGEPAVQGTTHRAKAIGLRHGHDPGLRWVDDRAWIHPRRAGIQ